MYSKRYTIPYRYKKLSTGIPSEYFGIKSGIPGIDFATRECI